MSAWRREAFERLPECRSSLQESKNPYAFWIELQGEFKKAFREGDDDLFVRIVQYAVWCIEQPAGKASADDLGTCVYCCFLEHLHQISPSVTGDGPSQLTWQGSRLMEQPEIQKLYTNLIARKRAT